MVFHLLKVDRIVNAPLSATALLCERFRRGGFYYLFHFRIANRHSKCQSNLLRQNKPRGFSARLWITQTIFAAVPTYCYTFVTVPKYRSNRKVIRFVCVKNFHVFYAFTRINYVFGSHNNSFISSLFSKQQAFFRPCRNASSCRCKRCRRHSIRARFRCNSSA